LCPCAWPCPWPWEVCREEACGPGSRPPPDPGSASSGGAASTGIPTPTPTPSSSSDMMPAASAARRAAFASPGVELLCSDRYTSNSGFSVWASARGGVRGGGGECEGVRGGRERDAIEGLRRGQRNGATRRVGAACANGPNSASLGLILPSQHWGAPAANAPASPSAPSSPKSREAHSIAREPASERNRRSRDPGRLDTRLDTNPRANRQLSPMQPGDRARGSVLRRAVQRVPVREPGRVSCDRVCSVHPVCQGTLPGASSDPDFGVASRRSAAALSEWPRSATEVTVTPSHVLRCTPSLWPVLRPPVCVLSARRADLARHGAGPG
jgi:hypothetical protein